MTRDEIIKLARESGSIDSEEVIETVWNAFSAAEREECAKLAAWILKMPENDVSHAIRARGEK